MTTQTDTYSAVATMLPKLKEICSMCANRNSNKEEVGYGDCPVCRGQGWKPSRDLQNIIQNIEYPFTLVLQNDMIGWMAEIKINGKEFPGLDTPAYDTPIAAVYAALYRTLTTIRGNSYGS